MLEALLQVVLPVFVVAALGFVYASKKTFPVGAITDLIVNLTGACLVFGSLGRAERFDLGMARAPVSAALLIFSGVVLAALAHRFIPRLRAFPFGAVALPVAFMNAGNLGLPVAELTLGARGIEVATVVFVTFNVLLFTLGLTLAVGKMDVFGVLRLPIFHAAWLGLIVNQLELELPTALATPVLLLGNTVAPMMLLALGARLRTLLRDAGKPSEEGRPAPRRPDPVMAIVVVVLRMGGGGLAALGINAALGNEGPVAAVILLIGCMPPAVMTFALTEKYTDAETSAVVSSAIALGTGLALVVLPAVVAFVSPS